MSNCCDRFVMIEGEEDSFETWQGLRGPYYTPSVSEDGTLSWTNNGGLQNPADKNIKGPPGDPGSPGEPGPGVPAGGTTGQLLAKASDEDYDGEWIDQPDLDAGGVTYDPAESYDDGTVGKELSEINSALTSLSAVTEIIDTASGAIASFPDGSGLPMRSLLAQINPVQDLHGYDAPWAGGSGKNLFDQDTCTTGKYIGETGNIADWTNAEYSDYIAVTAGQQYIFSGTNKTGAQGSTRIHGYNSSKAWVQQITTEAVVADAKWNTTFTVPEGISFVRVSTGYPLQDGQLEKGSTATAWAPYANECPISGWTGLSGWVEDEYDPTEQPTFSVIWQTEAGTVYDGYIDVVSGELVATHGVSVENSSDGWRFTGDGIRAYKAFADIATVPNTSTVPDIITNYLTTLTFLDLTGNRKTGITLAANSTNVSIRISSEVSDTTALNTYLSNNPLQIVYKLATPIVYQLTPQQISTLLGNNTVFVNTGSVSVTYQASIKGYIDKVLAS